ncbi:MAG: Ig-like domain-containing protein, partial [Halieaceae bacterium]|nr:Ig-like domain-containing protein [Halieaceae bacterium]
MLKRLGLLLLISLVASCGGGSDASFDNGDARLLQAIEVNPADSSLPVGLEQPFTATGIYTDGSREDITGRAAWTVQDTRVALIDAAGLASAVEPGTTRVIAALDGLQGETTLTVTTAVASRLQILPPAAELPVNATQDYRAFAVYSDGQVENVTFSAEWSLEQDTGIVAPFDASEIDPRSLFDDFGTAIARSPGTDRVIARFAGLEARSDVTVRDATLLALSVTPTEKRTYPGSLVAYTATGSYSDGSVANLSKVVSWTSSDSGVATISSSGDERGIARALSPGDTTVTASLEGLTASASLTVITNSGGPGVARLSVLPADQVIGTGDLLQYTAIGYSGTGESFDLTNAVRWTSSAPESASIEERGGLAQGRAAGQTTISARYESVTASTGLSVVGAEVALTGINVEPIDATLFVLGVQQYSAIGVYADGSRRDLTSSVLWDSADRDIIA